MGRIRLTSAAVWLALALPLPLAGPAAAATPQPRDTEQACPPQDVPEDGFVDVPADNVHEFAVDCATMLASIQGREGRRYAPGEALTRGQTATLVATIVHAYGNDLPSRPRDHFRDDDASVHEDSIDRLAELGVLAGRSGTSYDPDAAVTRGQLATVLVRALEQRTRRPLESGTDWFTDDAGDPHEPSIDKAAGAGLLTGTSDGRYSPGAPMQRDQVASVLVRAADLLFDRGYASCPEIYPPSLRIRVVRATGSGDDLGAEGEHVELFNGHCDNLRLADWHLDDQDGNVIPLPEDVELPPLTVLRVYTGSGASTTSRYYAGLDEPVWDDDGDTATLVAPGAVADTYTYEKADASR